MERIADEHKPPFRSETGEHKKSILVLYYTQTGQLLDILQSITATIQQAEISFAAIEPTTPFPWPWNAYQFFDAMPETVQRIPIALNPLPKHITDKHYDLIILGYQPWFLHPSQPINSFLKNQAASLFKNKPVITVIGCRNMWLHAQECVKQELQHAGARLVGNIVLKDSHTNLISLLTIIRWSFKGKKQASGLLPAAGVQQKDIEEAARFGKIISKHLANNSLERIHPELQNEGAFDLNPGLVLLEQRGIKNFRFWAKFIREKGGPGDPNRRGRILLFKRLLLVGIFVLSPLSSVSALIKKQMKKKKLEEDAEYFRSLRYEPGKI